MQHGYLATAPVGAKKRETRMATWLWIVIIVALALAVFGYFGRGRLSR
jgi:hypothetical protein